MERVLYLGGAVVEPKGIIKHSYLIPLSTVITVPNLGKITMSGDTPQQQQN
ncbi:hypothetical protein M1771_06830 [Spiroplasma citri]|nr:hypothetical protein M1771_06830 [Spiroplasma citri]